MLESLSSPGWVAFRHGSLPCLVVSDGVIRMGDARATFPDAPPETIETFLRENYLPVEHVLLNINVLLVETPHGVVMFDSGVGSNRDWGQRKFGQTAGRLLDNLRSAGVDPQDIAAVAITHCHPDHVWGLVDDDGRPLFPNAEVWVSRVDFEYFTDPDRLERAVDPAQVDRFAGARRNLLPYRDRLRMIDDGDLLFDCTRAWSTPGHTPGHLVFAIESDGEVLVNWGDLCHHEVLLLQHPEWQFVMDIDGPAAVVARMSTLREVHAHRFSVLGYHFPFPGLGHITAQGDGFVWLPADAERKSVDDGDSAFR